MYLELLAASGIIRWNCGGQLYCGIVLGLFQHVGLEPDRSLLLCWPTNVSTRGLSEEHGSSSDSFDQQHIFIDRNFTDRWSPVVQAILALRKGKRVDTQKLIENK